MQTNRLTTVSYSDHISEPPSVEDDVNLWRYTILELHASTMMTTVTIKDS